ncbi:metalloregulator ArsR/SmtB family transcription factor [Rossellomorea aquimaris]|uniref:Helix-turn-helix transcriptional regulator n=1 Tax=Rossellomorea aquimaris TaxID=189382 RepID=A0A5D4TYG9_9BACI|nr:metalloregulator ArsR/SmtB family transcription factor [Rossellomorea aquimaris]TYS80032.1 helix-turn-helix transcriptional regulator [Rossellomorea aquimaris]TYS85418.1 helix-turn-helix transcriptional regulator [Rossellomorea aquimaris]
MKEADVCEVACVEDEKVNRLKSMILSQNTSKVAEIFKALSDQTRAKIAYALTIEEELCVCDVANIVDASTATASHHLRLLKKQGLAKFRKNGKLVYYSLDDHHVKELIEIALTHQMELEERDR